MSNKRINVTKSYLPPKEEYIEKISLMWENHFLTNYGPLNTELVEKLSNYLNIEKLHYTNNGTISIQLCLDALGYEDGEIITTPFTFIATSSAIVWQKLTPVFVDINENDFNINADKIEEKITDKTRAILAVHCFGIPCDVDKIEEIAKKHNIAVIYDAAHSFGTKIGDRSVLSYGDMSSCSLHGTKVYHSIEGGLVAVNNDKYQERINAIRNFGNCDGTYKYIGINAKNSEFHAAMGLCVFDHLDEILSKRKENYEYYKELLNGYVYMTDIPENFTYNYIYFPIVFKNEEQLLKCFDALAEKNVFARRYFYPSLNDTGLFGESNTPVATDISKRIGCLPLDTYLEKEDIELICDTIKNNL